MSAAAAESESIENSSFLVWPGVIVDLSESPLSRMMKVKSLNAEGQERNTSEG